MVADVLSPGKRLIANAQAAPCRALAEFAEIRRRAVDAAERHRRDARADQHQIGAKLLHDVEFALGAIESPAALRLRQAFEIAKGLEQRYGEPGVARHLADVGGRAVETQEVVLEYLDAVEAGGGDRGELLGKVAADRDRGDRGLHLFAHPRSNAAAAAAVPTSSANPAFGRPLREAFSQLECRHFGGHIQISFPLNTFSISQTRLDLISPDSLVLSASPARATFRSSRTARGPHARSRQARGPRARPSRPSRQASGDRSARACGCWRCGTR